MAHRVRSLLLLCPALHHHSLHLQAGPYLFLTTLFHRLDPLPYTLQHVSCPPRSKGRLAHHRRSGSPPSVSPWQQAVPRQWRTEQQPTEATRDDRASGHAESVSVLPVDNLPALRLHAVLQSGMYRDKSPLQSKDVLPQVRSILKQTVYPTFC